VHEKCQSDNEQEIDDNEFLGFPSKKKLIDEIEVIGIEDSHEAQQGGGGSPKI
jgi:hypothetical protein